MKLILLFLLPCVLDAQGLSSARVKRIKDATVRIITPYGNGTGFFVDRFGDVVTCWHVVDSAVINGAKIMIEYENGDTIQVQYVYGREQLKQTQKEAYAYNHKYDMCVLGTIEKLPQKITFLKLGKLFDANEGDEIYTCGYPLGYQFKFLSKGIISTIYENRDGVNQAYLDITLNRGNSGGPVVRIGENIDKDEVIGIASFGIGVLDQRTVNAIINKNLALLKPTDTIDYINPHHVALILTQAINNVSLGVNGMVSIDYIHLHWEGKL